MSITVIGILVIAALFFVVTMAIAVGPLLLCRLLAGGGRDECRPQPRRSSLASGVLTFCGVVIGVAVGLVVLRFALSSSPQRSTATVVHTLSEPAGYPVLEPEPGPFDGSVSLPGAPYPADLPVGHVSHLPVEVVEHSLFAPSQFPPPSPAFSSSRANFEIAWVVLMPLLLIVFAIAVLGSERIRTVLVRMVPVFLAAALLGVLFFWSFNTVSPPQVAEHSGINTYPPPVIERPLPPPQVERRQPPAVAPLQRGELPTTAVGNAGTAADSSPADEAGQTEPASTLEADSQDGTPPVLTYVGTAAGGAPAETLPEWTHRSGDQGPMRVIDSGLHATVQLAEEHALEKLKSLLQAEMVLRTPQAAGWEVSDQVVLNADNILQRAVERTQIEVGDNTIPMYEAYWEVDLSRLEPLYRAWRPEIVQQRLMRMAGGVALLMLLLGSIAGFLKVDEQTHGRRRKSLAAGSLTLLALVAGLALVIVV